MDEGTQEPSLAYDPVLARRLLGQLVLVGLSTCDRRGELLSREQFWGRVEAVDPEEGIRLRLGGAREGERYTLPPDTSALKAAKPGAYRLASTGEVIQDPDWLATWMLHLKGSTP